MGKITRENTRETLAIEEVQRVVEREKNISKKHPFKELNIDYYEAYNTNEIPRPG